MPDEFVEWGKSWLDKHPGWTMKTWTEKELPPSRFPKTVATALSLIDLSDAFRYEILLREGGVYVDTDFECVRNIEGLIDGHEAFTAAQTENPDYKYGFLNGAFLGATPGHPAVETLVANLDRVTQPKERGMWRWGPPYVTRFFADRSDVTIFEPKLFYPYPWGRRRQAKEFPDAYAVHHWATQWYPHSQDAAAIGDTERLLPRSFKFKILFSRATIPGTFTYEDGRVHYMPHWDEKFVVSLIESSDTEILSTDELPVLSTIEVPLAQIVELPPLRVAGSLTVGNSSPPILVRWTPRGYFVLDGRHRYEHARNLGAKTITAINRVGLTDEGLLAYWNMVTAARPRVNYKPPG